MLILHTSIVFVRTASFLDIISIIVGRPRSRCGGFSRCRFHTRYSDMALQLLDRHSAQRCRAQRISNTNKQPSDWFGREREASLDHELQRQDPLPRPRFSAAELQSATAPHSDFTAPLPSTALSAPVTRSHVQSTPTSRKHGGPNSYVPTCEGLENHILTETVANSLPHGPCHAEVQWYNTLIPLSLRLSNARAPKHIRSGRIDS